MHIDLNGWLDAGAWLIGKINYVLDRLYFEEQIVKTIPKAENTFKHKYDQSNTNQRYSQSDQNDITTNTIKMTLEVVIVALSLTST